MKIQHIPSLSLFVTKLVFSVIAVPTIKDFHSIPLQKNERFHKNATHALFKLHSKYFFLLDQIEAVGSALKSQGSVEMTDNDDIEYYGTVKVGTPGQALKLVFDTGSSDLWFASSLCLLCGSHTRYRPLESSTYSFALTPWSIRYGDGSTAGGIVAKDSVDIGGITVKDQTIQLATHESSSFRNEVTDGLLGLGFSSLASVQGTITPVDNMIRQNLIKEPIFSVYLGSKSHGGGGEYVFGGLNSAHYRGELTTVPVDNSMGFWSVQVTSLSAGDTLSKTNKQIYGQFEAIVDTGTTLLVLQKDIATKVASYYHAKPNSDGTYVISCDSSELDPLQFSLGGSLFQIPGDALIYAKEGDHCIAGFATGDFPFSILGDVFIRSNYVVFNMKVPQIQLAPANH